MHYSKVKHQKVLQVISLNGKVMRMDKLLTYLNSLDPEQQSQFAARCGTTVGYLRKACSAGQRLSEGLCLRIGAESANTVSPEDLRADVDWPYLRKALAQTPANSAQAATETVANQEA